MILPSLPSVHGLCGGPAVNACPGLQHPNSSHQVSGEGQNVGILGLMRGGGAGSLVIVVVCLWVVEGLRGS